jgi:hypothetical protein
MKKKERTTKALTVQELRLVEQLRQHPEMMARVQSILELAYDESGPLKTADEVEELLIAEIRRLGNVTMGHWATQAEERVSRELRSQDPTVLSRKKNPEVVVRLRLGGGKGTDLVQPDAEPPAAFAGAIGGDLPGTVSAAGTGAHGLWQ